MPIERRSGRPRSRTWIGKLGAFVDSVGATRLAGELDADLRQIYGWAMGQGRLSTPTSESDRDRRDRASDRNASESGGYLRKRRHESQSQDAGASSRIVPRIITSVTSRQ
jgi:hypothetical protein